MTVKHVAFVTVDSVGLQLGAGASDGSGADGALQPGLDSKTSNMMGDRIDRLFRMVQKKADTDALTNQINHLSKTIDDKLQALGFAMVLIM